MLKRYSRLCLAALSVACFSGGMAFGQDYPSKPVRIITAPAGGGNDFVARLVARGISGPLGQQVIVDNRPTVLIADIVAKAPADGYTILLTGSAHWIGPLLEKVSYDPIRDFAPITLVDRAPTTLVVHPSMPVKSVKHLVALAKSRSGELNVSVGGTGSSNYLAAILFNHLTGVNLVRIPYKGTGPALTAVMSGEVHATFASAGGAAPHVKSGRLRALAVGSAEPSALAPGLPTIAASGVPGYVSEVLHAVLAPAKTPPAIVSRLNQEMSKYLQSAEAKELFLKGGVEAAPSSPEELTAIMKSEIARMDKVLKAAGVGLQ